MPYFRPSPERPRQTKRFLTAREVEDLAAAGMSEILDEDGLVITDAARETAHDLGVRINRAESNTNGQLSKADRVAPSTSMNPDVSGHSATTGAADGARPIIAGSGVRVRASDPLVEALVRAVRSNARGLA